MRALIIIAIALTLCAISFYAGMSLEQVSWHKERNFLAARALDRGIDLLREHRRGCEEDQ